MKESMVLLMCFALCGCLTMGKRIDENKASEIKEGVTTESQVIELLGTPFGKHVTDDGKTKLDYVFLRNKPRAKNFIPFVGLFISSMDQEKDTLQILIGKDGKVEKQARNTATEEMKFGLLA
ncbi:MAG: outer membrane protein assembly factor BamE [Candidatus Omnitrophota bacterium]